VVKGQHWWQLWPIGCRRQENPSALKTVSAAFWRLFQRVSVASMLVTAEGVVEQLALASSSLAVSTK